MSPISQSQSHSQSSTFPIMPHTNLNPRAAPFHPKKFPPPPPPFPFLLQARYCYFRRETRIYRPRNFSKVPKSPPKPITKPIRRNVPPRQRTPQYCRKRNLYAQWKPKNSFSGHRNKDSFSGNRKPRWIRGGGDDRTSVMIRNIPRHFRRHMLIELLDKLSEENHLEYDFVYLPMDFKTGNSLGYAFVNFTTAEAAKKIRELLKGYKWGCNQTGKICEVNYARIQGKERMAGNFKNSRFLCKNEEWLPVVFSPARNGPESVTEQITIGKLSTAM